ncbi:hypothetical protein [Tumebacillus lipolyticus]|uniref:Uncharacterized protein n=1 Tax=Tumebacillus lipolyticus TaxID=1280370 RepID=A0ABW4ZWC4_9BACL
MLNALEILKQARDLGSTATLAQVDQEIAKHNYDSLRASEKVRYEWMVWDKVSPINAIAPHLILADAPQDGEIYTVSVDGRTVILQKHDPEQLGFAPMTREQALAHAEKQVDSMVEQAVDAQVKDQVLRALL